MHEEPEALAPCTTLSRDGLVARVTITNPSALNALTRAMVEQALEVFRQLRSDTKTRAIILCGDGEHFCAGGSLARMLEQRSRPPHTQAEHMDLLNAWIMAMQECPQPVIAAVEGSAAGGGMALAMACDLIVSAEDARMTMSHTKIGLSPDCGASHWLNRALPRQLAMEIMLDAAPVPVRRLHELGVVNKISQRGRALAEASAWAAKLSKGPSSAYAQVKRLTLQAAHRSLRTQLDAERDGVVTAMYGDECREGVDAFLAKRAPRFSRT